MRTTITHKTDKRSHLGLYDEAGARAGRALRRAALLLGALAVIGSHAAGAELSQIHHPPPRLDYGRSGLGGTRPPPTWDDLTGVHYNPTFLQPSILSDA